MCFNLKRPCDTACPFRVDTPGFLTGARAQEIADSLLQGDSFICHSTHHTDDDGQPVIPSTIQHCAGAMILLERVGKPNSVMQVGQRLGYFDPSRLDQDAPVARTLQEFVDHHTEAWERRRG